MIYTKPVLISCSALVAGLVCRVVNKVKEREKVINLQPGLRLGARKINRESDIFIFTMKKEKKKDTIKSLRELCMVNYLDILETACSGFIQLALLDNPFLRSMVKSILPTLKNHLDSQLPPFSNDRDDLLKMALSGR